MMRLSFRPHRALAGLIALTVAVTSTAARADDDADAKPACIAIGNFIKQGDTDGLKSFIAQATGHPNLAAALDGVVQGVNNITAGKPLIEGPLLLAERNYGDTLHRAWYLLIRAGEPIYLRCNSIVTDGHWQLKNFDFNNDPGKIPLP